MSGVDEREKIGGGGAIFFWPVSLTAVAAMVISEIIAQCNQSNAHVTSGHSIPFWNLNSMFLLSLLLFVVIRVVDNINEFEYANLMNNGAILTNTFGVIFLLLTNPKVSVRFKTFDTL